MTDSTPDGKYALTRTFTTQDGVALYQIYLSDPLGELVRLTYEATQPRDLLHQGLVDLGLLLEQGGLKPLEGGHAQGTPCLFTRSQDLPVPAGSPRTVRYSAFRLTAPLPDQLLTLGALDAARRQAVGNARSFDIVFHLDRQPQVAAALRSLAGIFAGPHDEAGEE